MLLLVFLLSAPIGVCCQKGNYTNEGVKQWFVYVTESMENCHNKSMSSSMQREPLTNYIVDLIYCFKDMWRDCEISNRVNSTAQLKFNNAPCNYIQFNVDPSVKTLVLEILVNPTFHINLTFYRFFLGDCTSHEVQASKSLKARLCNTNH